MKYLTKFLVVLLSFTCLSEAVAQAVPTWAQALNSPIKANISKVVVDASGNSFIIGSTTDAAVLGPFSLSGSTANAPVHFVARLSAQGIPVWIRPISFFAHGNGIYDLALDAGGNLLICGTYRGGTLAFGAAVTLPPDPSVNDYARGFVAKFSGSGACLWAQALGDINTNVSASALALDAAGTSYVAINKGGTTPLVGSMGIWSYSATGVPGNQYSCADLGGNATTSPLGVFAGITDLVVNPLTGNLGGVVEFQGTLTTRPASGGGPVLTFVAPPEPQTGAVLFSLSAAGAVQWGQALHSTGISNGGNSHGYLNRLTGVTAVGSGFAVVGNYLGSGDVAGTPLAYSHEVACFVSRFDNQGNQLWLNPIIGANPGSNAAVLLTIAAGPTGSLYVGGAFGGTLPAGAGGFTSNGDVDVFVANYSPQGQLLSAQRDGGPGEEFAAALALDPSGQVIVAGSFTGNASFGGIALVGSRNENGFVARLARPTLASRSAVGEIGTFTVYPNPINAYSDASWQLTLDAVLTTNPTTLRLVNMLGQEVYTQGISARATTATVPTNSLRAGYYVLQVQGLDFVATRTVVIE